MLDRYQSNWERDTCINVSRSLEQYSLSHFIKNQSTETILFKKLLFLLFILLFYSFRVYYAFVTYSENSEAERAISHGNNDEIYQLDIRFGERKQTQVPYYDLGY